MVASACVIAQLYMLKRGAKLFNWIIDEQKLEICWRKRGS